MKKIIAITSAIAMMLALASCGGGTTDVSSEAVSSTGTPSTPSTTISIPTPSESTPPPVVEDNNLAHGDNATFIDMNTGKATDAEDYLAYYGGTHTLELAFDGSATTGWQVEAPAENLGKFVAEGEEPPVDEEYLTEIPEGAYLAEGDGNVYKQQVYEDGALWIGVTFEEAVTVDMLVFLFEHNAGVYAIEDGGYRIEYTTDGETWAALEGATVERVDDATANEITDTVTLEATELMGVRIVIMKGTTKYAPKVYEIEIYAPEEAEGTESVEETESTDETVVE